MSRRTLARERSDLRLNSPGAKTDNGFRLTMTFIVYKPWNCGTAGRR